MTDADAPAELLALQRWLSRVILERGRADQDCEAAEIARRIDSPSVESARRRLGAHVGGYPARIHEALSEAFPALRHVIGPAAFAELVERYRPTVPAGSYSLADVGALLAQFVGDDEVASRYPFVPDLARLEWAVQRAFHATPLVPLDPAPLVAWTPDQWHRARLQFQPDVAVVDSSWPIVDVWDARETLLEEIDIGLVDRPQCAVVHRSEYRVVCRAAPPAEGAVLARLCEGAALGEVIGELAALSPDADLTAEDVMGWFAAWTRARLVVACTTP